MQGRFPLSRIRLGGGCIMRARGSALIVICLMVAGYVASPFIALWRLEAALDRGDTQALERRVDWRAVRDGVKQDITDGVIGPVQAQLAANTLPPFGASFVAGIADTAVEREVTPQNLVAVMRQMRPAQPPLNPFACFDWAFFDGLTRFSIVVHIAGDEEDSHMRLRMELRAGTWTIIRAWIPQEIVERAAQRT